MTNNHFFIHKFLKMKLLNFENVKIKKRGSYQWNQWFLKSQTSIEILPKIMQMSGRSDEDQCGIVPQICGQTLKSMENVSYLSKNMPQIGGRNLKLVEIASNLCDILPIFFLDSVQGSSTQWNKPQITTRWKLKLVEEVEIVLEEVINGCYKRPQICLYASPLVLTHV